MGINEQILSASSDIELALARVSLKALTAQKVSASAQGNFASVLAGVGRLASQLTDAAETRNWLMLPFEIRDMKLVSDYKLDHITLPFPKAYTPLVKDSIGMNRSSVLDINTK